MRVIVSVTFMFIIVFSYLSPASVHAKDPVWNLTICKPEKNDLTQVITRAASGGLIPVGISSFNEKFYILSLRNLPWKTSGWTLRFYKDEKMLAEGIEQDLMDVSKGQGIHLFPAGFTIWDGQYCVLMLHSSLRAENAVISTCKIDTDSINDTVNNGFERGKIPVGISMSGGKLGVIMAGAAKAGINGWKLDTFSIDDTRLGAKIETNINNRLIPVDILVSGKQITFLFARLEPDVEKKSKPVEKTRFSTDYFEPDSYVPEGIWEKYTGNMKMNVNLEKKTIVLTGENFSLHYSINGLFSGDSETRFSLTLSHITALPRPDATVKQKTREKQSLDEFWKLDTFLSFKLVDQSDGFASLFIQNPETDQWNEFGLFMKKHNPNE